MKKNQLQVIMLIIGLLLPMTSFSKTTEDSIGEDLQYVPNDWENDIWLNSYFRELKMNETYQITARRIPEIIDDPISNNVVLPTFHYTVVRGNSVSVSAGGLITANSLGTSIIEVKYDEKEAYGETFGAVSPVNITYMAVNVVTDDIQNAIDITTDIDLLHYDKQYFFGSGIDYSFTATATGATSLTVKCNDVEAKKDGDTYTVRLKNRDNIIEISAKNDTYERVFYYVVDARKVELTLQNVTESTRKVPIVGDKVRFSFKGITLPVPKLATIYNPQMENPAWGATATRVVFDNVKESSQVKTNVELSQWGLATKNTIEVTLSESGEYLFKNGHIAESWWGSPLGTELDMTGPGQPNLNAGTVSDVFSALPAFRIYVLPAELANNAVELNLTSTTTPSSFAYNDKDVWTETYNQTGYPNIVSQDFSFSHLPSGNSWSGVSWEGFTVSKSTDNAVNHSDFPTRQWGCMAQGGVDGEATPYLVGYYSSYYQNPDSNKYSNAVMFKDNEDYEPQGTFVCNTAYSTKCIEDGFFVARPFTKNDTYTLIAHAIDADKKETGKTATYYLADCRYEKPQNRILNNRWEWFDLTSLGECAGFYLTMESTDTGAYGMNTASYFAMDKLVAVPVTASGVSEIKGDKLAISSNWVGRTISINQSGNVALYSMNGVKVYASNQYTAGTDINVANLSKGVYIVSVNGENQKVVVK